VFTSAFLDRHIEEKEEEEVTIFFSVQSNSTDPLPFSAFRALR